MKSYIFAILTIFCTLFAANAETSSVEIKVEFPLGVSTIEPDFGDNSTELARVPSLLSLLGDNDKIADNKSVHIVFRGTTSLEGSHELNQNLAFNRLVTLEKYIRSRFEIPDSVIEHDGNYIHWDWLRNAVMSSTDMPSKAEVLRIIDEKEGLVPYRDSQTIDVRVLELQKVDNGKAWEYMSANMFPKMRWASIYAVVVRPNKEAEVIEIPETEDDDLSDKVVAKEIIVEVIEEVVEVVEVVEGVEPEPVAEEADAEILDDLFLRRCYIKTNLLGWALLQTNIAVEFDLARHWSVALPAYYSAWNYFKSTIKFRTTDLKPQVRYWLSGNNRGWYFGAHFGLTWYNYAFNGKYRYQDYDRRTPAIGGGLGFGYRLPISSNGRWHLEFGLSAGAYHLHYDKFLNEPNGRRVAEERKTYIGLDNAAITFSYSFGLRKKGGTN